VRSREILDVKFDQSGFQVFLLAKSDREFIYLSVSLQYDDSGRLTGLIFVFSSLSVHEDLSNTVERSKDELVEHEADHDRLRASVRGRDSQSWVKVE
jgi:hypothetical protein